MLYNKREIEDLILELLNTAPSSFAALYGYVFRQSTASPSVDELLAILAEFEARGWIRSLQLTDAGRFRAATEFDRVRARAEYRRWLDEAGPPALTTDKLSLDEVGLWVEVEPNGRREWSGRASQRDADSQWVVDQDDRAQTIVVYAEDLASAERVLQEWLRQHPTIHTLPQGRSVDAMVEYPCQDGAVVKSGVRLKVAYEVRT